MKNNNQEELFYMTNQENTEKRTIVYLNKSRRNMPKILKLNRKSYREYTLREKYGHTLWFQEWEREIIEQISIKA